MTHHVKNYTRSIWQMPYSRSFRLLILCCPRPSLSSPEEAKAVHTIWSLKRVEMDLVCLQPFSRFKNQYVSVYWLIHKVKKGLHCLESQVPIPLPCFVDSWVIPFCKPMDLMTHEYPQFASIFFEFICRFSDVKHMRTTIFWPLPKVEPRGLTKTFGVKIWYFCHKNIPTGTCMFSHECSRILLKCHTQQLLPLSMCWHTNSNFYKDGFFLVNLHWYMGSTRSSLFAIQHFMYTRQSTNLWHQSI